MPFNYQSLKNLTTTAIVDGTLQESDIADLRGEIKDEYFYDMR
jgi:hypothetical protein